MHPTPALEITPWETVLVFVPASHTSLSLDVCGCPLTCVNLHFDSVLSRELEVLSPDLRTELRLVKLTQLPSL